MDVVQLSLSKYSSPKNKIFFEISDVKNSKVDKECMGTLTLLPLRNTLHVQMADSSLSITCKELTFVQAAKLFSQFIFNTRLFQGSPYANEGKCKQ